MTAINEQDIERFLKFLDSDTEVFNYSLFHDPSGEIVKPGIRFGTRSEILQALQHEPSTTLHVTLNRTKLSGRKKSDVESCRVLCVDLDREVSDEEIRQIVEKFYPHLVVRSSPNKYHIYWKVSADLGLEEWSNVQAGLAWFFKADENLSQPTHLMRVPGLSRLTKTGEQFMPEIVWHEERPEETKESLLTVFPGLQEMKDEARKQKESKKQERKKKLDAHRQGKTKALEELAAEENRNQTLYDFIRDFVYRSDTEPSEEEVLQRAAEFNTALAQVNPKGALAQEEVERTALSAVEAGRNGRETREARRAERTGQVSGQVSGQDNPAFPYDFTTKGLLDPYNEEAIVERIKQRFGESIIRVNRDIYAFDAKSFTWIEQTDVTQGEILTEMYKRCRDDMLEEPGFVAAFGMTKDGLSENKLSNARSRWKAGARQSATLGSLRREELTRFDKPPFDRDEYLYFCKNGVLNLKTGDLRQPKPEDYLLHNCGINFNPNAKWFWWETFLEEIFRENQKPAEVIAFLQEVFGYALTGSIREQMIFIHYGSGANGKSRVMSALAGITGDYTTRLQPDSLGVKRRAPGKILERIAAKTEGRRCVLIEDLDTGMEWNEGLIKSLTAETITARRLFGEERDIPNFSKIHINCNEIPKVENSSHAVYRRLAILEYARKFEVNPEKHEEISINLEKEREGILNWSFQGLQRILARENGRINYPEEVIHRVAEYEDANSTLEKKLARLFMVLPVGDDEWVISDDMWKHIEESGVLSVEKLEHLGKEGIGALLARLGVRQKRCRVGDRVCRYYAVRLIPHGKDPRTLFN